MHELIYYIYVTYVTLVYPRTFYMGTSITCIRIRSGRLGRYGHCPSGR